MRKSTSKKSEGFTIVELLIVIVVIAILAAISIVAYTGIQQRANNSSRIAAGDQWAKALRIYEAQVGAQPPSIVGAAIGTKFCLGTGFPVGGGGVRRCQNVNGTDSNSPAESASTTLMSELQSVTNLPTTPPIPVQSAVTGPYYYKYSTFGTIVIGVNGVYASGADCGGGFTGAWTNNTSASTCEKRV